MNVRPFFILVLLCSLTLTTMALPVVVLKDDIRSFELKEPYVGVYEDVTNKLSIDGIRQLNPSVFEEGLPIYNLNFKHNYWIKFTVDARTSKPHKWILEVLDSRHNEVVLYTPDAQGNYQSTTTGLDYRKQEDDYGHKNFILDLEPLPGRQTVYYIKFRSKIVGTFFCKIRSNQEFSSYAFAEYYLLGLYYGILFIIALYNLIIFFTAREKLNLLYFLYVMLWGWHSLLDDGIGMQYLWPSFPLISKIGFYISKPLLISLFVLYSRIFLNIRHYSRINDAYVLASLYFYLLYEVVSLIFGLNFHLATNVFFLIPFLLIYYNSVRIYKKNYKPARLFIIGNSFIILGVVLKMAKNLGYIDYISDAPIMGIFTVYSMNIGMVLEISILSIALGDRIRFLKAKEQDSQMKLIEQFKENELLSQKVTRELEEKVAERTEALTKASNELKEANLKLAEQAAEISRWNQSLDRDNYNLKSQVKEAVEARIKYRGFSFEEFLSIYPDDLSCQRYIENIKWKNGYKCKKCGNEKFCAGSKKFARRCTKCRYDESVTAYTILHKCKFPLVKAFYIMAKVNKYEEDLNYNEIALELQMRKNTVWEFKKKVLEAKSNQKNKQNQEESLDQLLLGSLH